MGSAQMTLSTYILGFAFGQLLYGLMADSLGRKPVILGGTLVFAGRRCLRSRADH
jgi:DHA1 family bicyclomycin/chloramphenicol resistance-like MFS transporter